MHFLYKGQCYEIHSDNRLYMTPLLKKSTTMIIQLYRLHAVSVIVVNHVQHTAILTLNLQRRIFYMCINIKV